MGKIIYELPKKEKLIKILKFIPTDWNSFFGTLYAPKKLYEENKIAENTRLNIYRTHGEQPICIIGAKDAPSGEEQKYEDGIKSNVSELICKNKLFSSVRFNQAGAEAKIISFEEINEIVRYFIGLGYEGLMLAESRSDPKEHKSLETFGFCHYSHLNVSPNITLEWNREYGGKKENLNQILRRMDELGVKERSGWANKKLDEKWKKCIDSEDFDTSCWKDPQF